jgi:hypothetical protein
MIARFGLVLLLSLLAGSALAGAGGHSSSAAAAGGSAAAAGGSAKAAGAGRVSKAAVAVTARDPAETLVGHGPYRECGLFTWCADNGDLHH